MAQTLYLDDVDFPVKPKLCYGTTKLIRTYSGNAMKIRKFDGSIVHEVPFNTTTGNIDVGIDITPFVGSASPADQSANAATVETWYEQSGVNRNAFKSSFRAPRIKDLTMTVAAGAHPAIIFEGGSQNGQAFGLDIDLSGLGIGGPNGSFTAFAVIKPTMSIHRSNIFSAGVIPNGGAVLSIETTIPISTVGNITFGQQTLTVPDASNIFPSMWVQGPAFPGGALVQSKVGNVLTIGGLAAVTSTGFTDVYKFNNQIAKCALGGDDNIGGMVLHDRLNANTEPNAFPVEIGPTVMCWSQGTSTENPAHNGTQMFLNEHGYTNSIISSKLANPATYAFIGATGTTVDIGGGGTNMTIASQQNGAGDFWISALVIYNSVLSKAQRAFISSALYDRFQIKPAKSRVNSTTVWALGDSIGSGFVTLGIYSMFNKVQDDLTPSSVKVRSCTVAGSQLGPFLSQAAPGNNSASSQHIYDTMIRPIMRAGHPGKNILVIQGGGNDLIDSDTNMADHLTPFAFSSFATDGSGTITTTAAHGLAVGERVIFNTFSGGTGITAGNVYWVVNVGSSTTFKVSATKGGANVIFTGGPFTATMTAYHKTGAIIHDYLINATTGIVPKALADGFTKVFVCRLTPRTGALYNTVMDDYNALVTSGAAANNYTVIDLFGLFPNNDNPDGTVDLTNFTDGTHLNRTGSIAAGNLISTTIQPFI